MSETEHGESCFVGMSKEMGNSRGQCCCNCKHLVKISGHPWNTDPALNGRVNETKFVGCGVALADGGHVVLMGNKHSLCELHEFKGIPSGLDARDPMFNGLKVLAKIAKEYEANNLDDEARRFWGKNNEHENTKHPQEIELYCGRGGKRLLTLQDCIEAAQILDCLQGLEQGVGRTMDARSEDLLEVVAALCQQWYPKGPKPQVVVELAEKYPEFRSAIFI